MNNFDFIIGYLQSCYGKPPGHTNYGLIVECHADVIKALQPLWIDGKINSPTQGQKVLAIQDLRSIGRGAFVGDYFFENDGFVANRGDCDPYGNMLLWIGEDIINNLTISDLDKFGI